MTWKDLKNYIDIQTKSNQNFLDQDVYVYNYDDGSEYIADIVELFEGKLSEAEAGWAPYITINDEVSNGKIKKASIH